ncbi:MAG TPA: GAF domain-containing protein [bacterium]|nr:GAF domain-containing protein [bacterium]HPN32732.1 GAF domain-containing protein [bacterium]
MISLTDKYSLIYDIKNVLNLILTTIISDLKADIGSIMLVDEDKKELVIVESIGLSFDSILNISFKCEEGVAGKCFSKKQPIIINNAANHNEFKNFRFQRENIASIVSFPIIDNGEALAVINVSSSKVNNFNESTLSYLTNYAALILNAIKNLKFSNSSVSLNFIDENTGLYNYSFFIENLKRELDRSERYNEIFSLILIKINNFADIVKKWDDDKLKQALKYFAAFLKNTSRRVDICSMYDINLFAVITPETGKGGCLKKVERLYANVKNGKYYSENLQNMPLLEISCAISSYPEDGKKSNDILEHCLSQL